MNDTNLNNLRKEILSVIPSESLKRRLKEPDYRPSDQDLLVILHIFFALRADCIHPISGTA